MNNYWDCIYNDKVLLTDESDNWLDHSFNLIKNKNKALDLGCGLGNNLEVLINAGFQVTAIDISQVAITKVKTMFPNVNAECIDFQEPLPYEDNEFDLIVADLSLHYFDELETKEIVKELRRVSNNESILLFRVNSLAEMDNDEVLGDEIEPNLYFKNGNLKRYFSIEDVHRLFSEYGVVLVREQTINKYSKEKHILTAIAMKK